MQDNLCILTLSATFILTKNSTECRLGHWTPLLIHGRVMDPAPLPGAIRQGESGRVPGDLQLSDDCELHMNKWGPQQSDGCGPPGLSRQGEDPGPSSYRGACFDCIGFIEELDYIILSIISTLKYY